MYHIPVLKEEVLKALSPRPGERFIDATLGFAGHSKAILEAVRLQGGRGEVLGLERDLQVYQLTKEILKKEKVSGLKIVNGSFCSLKDFALKDGFNKVNGVLFDLGFNSWQIEHSGRGFTFQKDEPLDMRYSSNDLLTAETIVNTYSEKDLVKLLKKNSQEKFTKKIVQAIIEKRKVKPIKTTFELVEVIQQAINDSSAFKGLKSKVNPATRTFQALRIEVNQEFAVLKEGLKQAIEVLLPKGKLIVITFHSGEERIVKNFFKDLAKKKVLKIITKNPILPKKKEKGFNPRVRSAKLWVAEKN
ncbi:16S rRNA (cytosine(1402)-N(4))-methyltransferase RsmH [Candidatus Parcubacteria bacterium]|nr:16S rRNA (cytosine(1402)-N(4))-methyltransferase RsmH [Candidatus Parcubacteria bacterium]